MARRSLRRLQEKFLDAVFPIVTCDICGAELPLKHRRENEYPLCGTCFSMLKRQSGDSFLLEKTTVFQCFLYDDMTKNIILDCKENGKSYLARTMAAFMADAVIKSEEIFDAVCFVPTYKKKKRTRGYCHAEIIAECIAYKLDKPLLHALKQTVEIDDQTGLTQIERAKNVAESFTAAGDFAGKSLLLVDDVVATGATLTECVKALQAAGAENVSAICFASTERL